MKNHNIARIPRLVLLSHLKNRERIAFYIFKPLIKRINHLFILYAYEHAIISSNQLPLLTNLADSMLNKPSHIGDDQGGETK